MDDPSVTWTWKDATFPLVRAGDSQLSFRSVGTHEHLDSDSLASFNSHPSLITLM